MWGNNDNSGTALAVGLAGVAVIFWFFILAVALVVISLVLSVCCILAWRKPRQFLEWTITPEEAQLFVRCGSAVGLIVTILVEIWSVRAGIHPNIKVFAPFLGYAFGSVIICGMISAHRDEARKNGSSAPTAIVKPGDHHAAPGPAETPPTAPAPFTFAAWDDREARK